VITRAPVAMQAAETAVSAAEKPQSDRAVGAHLVFMADRSISIANETSRGRLAIEQRAALESQHESMRQRVDAGATSDAADKPAVAVATGDASNRETAAAPGRPDKRADRNADKIQDARDKSREDGVEWRRQMGTLQAHQTALGLVLTPGEVLFAFDQSTLDASDNTHLGRLATFLARYPNRNLQINGFTDNVGTGEYNQELSVRRADAVKTFLVGQGISAGRLATTGMGMSAPIGNNESATGRQQNRRVEVIIGERLVSSK
jgi:outer membrane protein OmpA-like peptidoglycan-associated protein